MGRIAIVALILVFAVLQYRLWVADGGVAQVHRLQAKFHKLEARNDTDRARNDAMQAEVDDLKSGRHATEGRARAEMGMIKRDERFFLTVAPQPEPASR